MAEFVKKDDGSNVKLRVRKGVTLGPAEPGLVGYIKDFATKYQHVSYGHLVSLEIFVPDNELMRAGGFAPHLQLGAKVQITLVENGVVGTPIVDASGKVEAVVSQPTDPDFFDPKLGEPYNDSDPAGEEEDEDDYEDDTSGPPPVIPPSGEPTAEQENQENDKYKPKGSDTLSAKASDLLFKLQQGLDR